MTPEVGVRRVGAYTPDPYAPLNEPSTNIRILQELDNVQKEQRETSNVEKGTLQSIGKIEERRVYVARGCGEFDVALADGRVGRQLFTSLRNIMSWTILCP